VIERAANDNAKEFKKRTSDFHTFECWMKSSKIVAISFQNAHNQDLNLVMASAPCGDA
jgi:hypothetical protein